MRLERIGETTLYQGDCLDILCDIGKVDTLITDPVWPDNNIDAFQGIDAYGLFKRAWQEIIPPPRRAVFHLGCDSNPAILSCVDIPFFRVASLEYVAVGYKGRLLYTGDIAYFYGEPPRSIPGKRVISGRCQATLANRDKVDHPCPRNLEHVEWYTYQFTEPEDVVLDPFMGSGTTGVACVNLGRPFLGIEIEPRYFDIACRRIEDAYKQPRLFKDPKQEPVQEVLCDW